MEGITAYRVEVINPGHFVLVKWVCPVCESPNVARAVKSLLLLEESDVEGLCICGTRARVFFKGSDMRGSIA